MSFTPGAPIRRSFKEDREERRKRKEARQRLRIIGVIAALAVIGGLAWGWYAQADILATINSWQHPAKPASTRAVVAVHAAPYHPYNVKAAGFPGATPTPLATATPVPTPTPTSAPSTTPTPVTRKTPKPRTLAAVVKPRSVSLSVAATPFSLVTPAPLVTPQPTPAPATPVPTATPGSEVYAPQIVVDARFSSRVEPQYPEIAREQNIGGEAIVLVTVGPKGNVISQRLEKSAGHPMLDQAALSAASRSSFLPPRIDGKPATETYRIYYEFTP